MATLLAAHAWKAAVIAQNWLGCHGVMRPGHRCSTGVSQVFRTSSLCFSLMGASPSPATARRFPIILLGDHSRSGLPGALQCWSCSWAEILGIGSSQSNSRSATALNQSQAVLLKGGKIAKTFPKVCSIETRLLWWIIQSFMRFPKMVPSWKLRRTSAKRMADPEII